MSDETPPMTDDDLLADFTRVTTGEAGTTLECMVITWPQPHRPDSHWVPVRTLPSDFTPGEIEAARRALLKLRRYFKVCRLCGERKPDGWMMDKDVCHSCAEEQMGVVF
jgi:hypothetical protein